jgi:hydrogenase-4 component F
MAVLLIVIFVGFLNHFRTMYFDMPPGIESAGRRGPPSPVSRWCVLPMWLALVPLLAFGVWWPQGMWHHFTQIAQSLTGGTP